VLLALGVALLIANSVGQLAKQMPSAGGLYTSLALGPKVGFLVGWAFLLAEPLVAPLLYLAATTADVFQNKLGIIIPWWVWVLVAAGLVFYLTYLGIRLSANAGIVLGIFEIVAFLGLYMIFAAGEDNTLGVFNPANSLEGTWYQGCSRGWSSPSWILSGSRHRLLWRSKLVIPGTRYPGWFSPRR
jgi:amino acid transporter